MKNPVIVIPVPKTPARTFVNHLPKDVPIIVVADTDKPLNLDTHRFDIYYYSDQQKILGDFYPEFRQFHHSSACRNFGHFLALKLGYDPIIALDYDCVVPSNFLDQHLQALKLNTAPVATSSNNWINPINSDDWFTRGYPYESRYSHQTQTTLKPVKVVFNMGLWNHVIDINGIDKVIQNPPTQIKLTHPYTVAADMLPISGMNNIFRADLVPAYCFLPNLKIGSFELSRHDDIWGGYILKKLIDLHGDQLSFGDPIVRHSRQSWLPGVLHHEHFMHLLNRDFYNLIDEAISLVKTDTYSNMFAHFVMNFDQSLNQHSSTLPPHYLESFSQLAKAMSWWTKLYQTLS